MLKTISSTLLLLLLFSCKNDNNSNYTEVEKSDSLQYTNSIISKQNKELLTENIRLKDSLEILDEKLEKVANIIQKTQDVIDNISNLDRVREVKKVSNTNERPSIASETSKSKNDESNNPFDNPFGAGGGGIGSAGSGTGLGNDMGPGTASNSRVRISDVHSKPSTPNNVSCQIALKIAVNADGGINSVKVIRQNTTTSNETVIQEIVELVKDEVKYETKPNVTREYCYYTVKLRPS